MTMLIMWLIELYLNDLGTLKEEGASAKKEDLEEEFRKFLAQTKVKVSGTKAKGCDAKRGRSSLVILTSSC